MKKKKEKKRLCCGWIREKFFVYYLGKDCFRKEKLDQKNNNLFFPFGKDYPFIKGKKWKEFLFRKIVFKGNQLVPNNPLRQKLRFITLILKRKKNGI